MSLVDSVGKLPVQGYIYILVVGHWFHFQNRLSEGQNDSIIEVTLVLALVVVVCVCGGVGVAV